MSKQVYREKYEKTKEAANSWMKEYKILKNKLESIPELEEEIFHLEEENKKQIEILQKQQKDIVENYQNKINNLERDILRKDGK